MITRDQARKLRDEAISHETGGPKMSPDRLEEARGIVRGLLERSRDAVRARGELTERVAKRYELAIANAGAITPEFLYDGELDSGSDEFPTIGGQNLVNVLARGAK